MDLDIAERYKHDLMDILGELHIQVDNLVAFQTFQKRMSKQDDPVLHGTPNLVHRHQINIHLVLLLLHKYI